MFRLPQIAGAARGLRQAPLRLSSTAPATAIDQDASASDALSRPADWDSAKPYSAIPGPKPLPIVGNVWRFLPMGEFYKVDSSNLFRRLNETYGPLVKFTGLGKPDILIIYDPNIMEQVFRNEGAWPSRQGADSLDYYFRNLRKNFPPSLVVSQGKEWQEFRTAVNQVMMQPRNTRQYVEPIDSVSQEFIERMRAIRNEKLEMPPDFFNEIAKWALESITLVALDARLGVLKNLEPDSEASRMIAAVHDVFEGIYKLDFLPSPWKYVSTPTYRKFINSMDYFTEISAKYVNLAMTRLQEHPPAESRERTYSVLENLLIRTGDPQRAVTMALDMMLAGIDTTGMVVATILYQLANHPEKQQKLQEELDRVMPDPSKSLTKEQLEQMRYMRACIKETMRIMPIIVGTGRNTVKDMVIGGYQVPKGTMANMSAPQVGRNEAYFPKPNEFLPERWLPGEEDLKIKNPFAFLPFGFGPRMCVGKRFADLEIETIVAKMFRNFTIEWNRPQAKGTFRVIYTFIDPLVFTVKDRV